jgi:hypothetical protein
MAFNAKAHFKLLTLKSVHSLDGAVTFKTGNFFSDVPLVIEQHVLGQVIHLYPGC